MFAELFNKKIIFVSGKGGTGKSFIAAVLALLAAQKGKRVLLAESHAFDKLAPLFGHQPIGHKETQVSERVSCINLNAKRCFAEYVILHLGMEALYDRVFRSQPVTSLLDAIPGLDETMILGRLFHTCELTTKFDLVIYDSPASGHFLKMFATPDAIIKSGLVGPLVKEVTRVKAFLSDAQKATGVFVTLPETLVMNETLEFIPLFNSLIPLHLSGIFLNRSCMQSEVSFTPAIQKHYERKFKASQDARQELLNTLKANPALAQHLYCVPDLEFVNEPLSANSVRDILPLIEEINLA